MDSHEKHCQNKNLTYATFPEKTPEHVDFTRKKKRYLICGQRKVSICLRMWTPSLLVGVLSSLSLSQHAIICASVLVSVVIFAQTLKAWIFTPRRVDRHGNGIPPGPVGLPILGVYFWHSQVLPENSLKTRGLGSFPFLTNYPELTLDYWAKRFGPIYSLWLGNQLFVIVSDPNIVRVRSQIAQVDPPSLILSL